MTKKIVTTYLDTFLEIFSFFFNESYKEENFRNLNQNFLLHFIKLNEAKIEKMTEKLKNFESNLNSKTEEKLKKINESHENLKNEKIKTENCIEQMMKENEMKNQQIIKFFETHLVDLKKSVEERKLEFSNNENFWMDEVHKLATQKFVMKIYSVYKNFNFLIYYID